MSTQTATAETLRDDKTVEVDLGPMAPLAEPGTILPGTTWKMNGTWTISKNQKFVLIAQGDGNLVLYEVVGNPPHKGSESFSGRHKWDTETDSRNKHGNHVSFQTDGNYVVYRSSDNSDPLWETKTDKKTPLRLVVQDDGNLVLYVQEAAWASNTART